MQQAFEGIYSNMAWFFRGPLAGWTRLNSLGSEPSDKISGQIAVRLQTPGDQRDALTAGIFIPTDLDEGLGRLENAFNLVSQSAPILRRISEAVRAGRITKGTLRQLIPKSAEAGIITRQEAALLRKAEEARDDAIQVDSFTHDEYMNRGQGSLKGHAEAVAAA